MGWRVLFLFMVAALMAVYVRRAGASVPPDIYLFMLADSAVASSGEGRLRQPGTSGRTVTFKRWHRVAGNDDFRKSGKQEKRPAGKAGR